MIARNIYFYDTLVNFVRKLGGKISAVKLADSYGHVWSNGEECLHHPGGYDYEVLNKKMEGFWYYMKLWTWQWVMKRGKESFSHFWVLRLLINDFFTQQKSLIFDFKMIKVKDTGRSLHGNEKKATWRQSKNWFQILRTKYRKNG